MSKSSIDLLEMFLESIIAERSLAKNSVISYFNDLKDFITYLQKNKILVEEVNTAQLIDYLSSFKNYKNASIARKISVLRQFYGFLFSEKIIKLNPALDLELPKKESSLPKALSIDQVKRMLSIAAEDKSVEGIRNYCFLEILYSTGMRVSELASLKLSVVLNPLEVKDNYQVIQISGKGKKERVVILNETTLAILHNYLKVKPENGNGYLFPSQTKSGKVSHTTRQMFHIIIKKIAKAAGVDPKITSLHKIRHSFATHMLRQGASLRIVQDLLGHSSISSTQIYTQVLSDEAKELVFTKHPLATTLDQN